MNTQTELTAFADQYILRKALQWLDKQGTLPHSVLRHADVLNAEKLGLSPGEVCGVWV